MERDEQQLLADVAALEPLSEDEAERMEQLRLIAQSETIIMDTCPECGVSLEGLDITAHANNHWPAYIDPNHMSAEAKDRKRAMMRAGAKQKLPNPHESNE